MQIREGNHLLVPLISKNSKVKNFKTLEFLYIIAILIANNPNYCKGPNKKYPFRLAG